MSRDLVTVALTSGGSLKLRADVNALCDFEAEMTRAGFDAVREMERFEQGARPPLSVARALVWACAVARHPDLTIRQVGAAMADDGAALVAGVLEALRLAAPAPDPDAEKPVPPIPTA